MQRTLHAEWTKLRTVPTACWLVAGMVAALAVIGPALVGAVDPNHCPPEGCPGDRVRLGLTGTWLAQVGAVVLGTLVATNDHATGEIVPTIVATPRRLRVAVAKAFLVAASTALAGLTGGALAIAFSVMADSSVDAGWATTRAVGGTALYLAVVALGGLGVGLAARETGLATIGTLAVLHAAPVVLRFVSDAYLRERLEQLSPTAGLAMQATRDLGALPVAPWVGLSVTAAWAAAATVCGVGALRIRDV